MAFIGNTPTQQAFTPAIDYFSGNGSTTAFTLSRPVASVSQVFVVVNNVDQNPTNAYTVSNNTITFSAAPSSGTNNIYVRYTSPITQVNALTQAPSVIGPMAVGINGATPLGGATNPILGASGSANNYVQLYTYNLTDGVNSSADFTAYPSNGVDSAGWVDMGITGPSFSQAAYSVTGPNEAYLFGSAPAGSGKTGNLVIATDSTGTTNSIQFYAGGFTQSKSATKFTVSTTGAYGQLVSGTAQASTSGTSIDFTSIPSWVKRVTVLLNGVSLSGTANLLIQAGSGSVQTTGYTSTWAYVATSATSGTATTGVYIQSGDPLYVINAKVELALLGSNIWIATGIHGNNTSTVYIGYISSRFSLSGALDRIRVTSTNGTDTFDAGSINILYEG